MSKYDTPSSEQEILPNRLGLTEVQEIQLLETSGFLLAEDVLLKELKPDTVFDRAYLSDLHWLALGHLYDFAGQYRMVNISKGGFLFPAAHLLPTIMADFEHNFLLKYENIFDLPTILRMVSCIHAELLFIHPFREGNGRTARLLADLMVKRSGLGGLDFTSLVVSSGYHPAYVQAVQSAASQDYEPMIELLSGCFRSS